jgi:peptide/nickel transport system substrate-binding protein
MANHARVVMPKEGQMLGRSIRSRWIRLGLGLSLLLGMAVSGCGTAATPQPEASEAPTAPAAATPTSPPVVSKDGSLRFAPIQHEASMDPHQFGHTETCQVSIHIYDPLVWKGPDGEFYPGLADSWEISEDGLSIGFELREGVTFHDGTPWDAEAACWNFDRIANPDRRSDMARGYLGPYDRCEVTGPYSIRVHFEEPHGALLNLLTTGYFGMVSPAAVEKWGEDDYAIHPVGTGPFVFKDWVLEDHITLVNNPDYNWAPDFFEHQGPAYLDELTFVYIAETETRVAALETGDLDVMNGLQAHNIPRFEDDPNYEVQVIDSPGHPSGYWINTTHYPWDDIRVRQALMWSIDQQQLVDTLTMGAIPPKYQALSDTTMCFWEEGNTMYKPRDLEKAAELLEEAGFVDRDGDGIREDEDGNPLYGKIIFCLDPRQHEALQAQAREAGFDLEVGLQECAEYNEGLREGTFELGWCMWKAPDPGVLETTFHSEGGCAASFFKDPELDEAIVMGRSSYDPEDRCPYYEEAQKIIQENALWLSVQANALVITQSTDVHGIKWSPDGWGYLYDAWVEE